MYIFYHILVSSSYNEFCCGQKLYRSKHTFYVQQYFFNRAVCELMWKNIVEPARPQIPVRHMRIAFWIPKATHACSEYVLLIAFTLQQWLNVRASMLRYTHIACIVSSFGHLMIPSKPHVL
jgi:hypothetical protein